MQFDMPKEQSSIIKVIGVGGGGSNAVNNMFKQGIKGVNFVICNTDAQALDMSPVPNKIQLGPDLTEGRGAGSKPEVGKLATEESIDQIREILSKNTKMVFITAGMGGGTGTGGAPVIAGIAKEMGILVVGIVTEPFAFEGKKRRMLAEEGVKAMKSHVDTILVVSNDKLRDIYGNLSLSVAFKNADDVLTTAAKGIAEIITVPGYINVDFEDVKTVMVNSGVAIMGSAMAEGDDRAIRAVKEAMASPLLADNDIRGANYILLNITSGNKEVLMDEITEITDYVQEAAGNDADIIWGNCSDESLGDNLMVTVIATGFDGKKAQKVTEPIKNSKVVMVLEDEKKTDEPVSTPAKGFAPVNNDIELKKPYASDEPVLKKPEPDADTRETRPNTIEFTINEDDKPVKETKPKEIIWPLFQHEAAEHKPKAEPEIKSEIRTREANAETPNHQTEPVLKSGDITGKTHENAVDAHNREEMTRRNYERIRRLRGMSMNLSDHNITELEKEPAYKRRNVELNHVPHSSEFEMSRFSLSVPTDGDDEQPNLRKGNSFLHDNVD